MTTHPEVTLFAHEGNLPSVAGSYLAACVVLQSITGRVPSEQTLVQVGLDAKTAKVLRQAALHVIAQ